ncbi:MULTISPECIES: SpoIIE family protein phosphatase [unclassified Streptomyces]|uniref:SpoIIE family protein phosphatase n=1 Tax=unclassified Streptomyces TaxID=2593676 RepID=UPI000939290C|nr:SpoIIE family protein phosphatase [Streptomyces sp. CB02400]
MADLDARGTPSRRFPPAPKSVAEARRFVRAALDGAAPDLVDTAQLLVSELVTNVVLHARTEAEVTARVDDGTVHVRVGDRRPDRGLVPHECPPYAGTGQGLPLVAGLSSRRGVDTGAGGKTVWFELRPEGPPRHPDDWEPAAAPSVPGTTVTLLDVPAALYAASQQHRHTLLREVALAAAAGHDPGVPPEDLAVALDMSQLITASVTAALRREPSGQAIRSLPLSVPPDAEPSVQTLRAVLDLAEEGAREERLLTLPALPRQRLFHQWLFDQIVGQLAGAHPTAWTVMPGEPGTSPSELVAWDAGQVQASRTPTIAADERNLIIAANGPAADLLGWHADDLVGRPLTTLIPEHLRRRHIAAFTSLLLSGQPRILGRSVPLPALHHDGRLVPVRLFIQPQETADGRTVFVAQLAPRAAVPAPSAHPPGVVRPSVALRVPDRLPPAAAADTGRESYLPTLERLSLLADTAAALSNAPHLDEGLEQVGRILTERLADWCVVDLFTEEAQVERVSIVYRSSRGPWPEEYQGVLPPVSDADRGPLARALRGAGPLLLTEPPAPSEAAGPFDAHHLGLLRTMGANSVVVTPLRARRQIIGALTLARRGRDAPFAEEDLPLVDDLVRNLALGVDNLRLYQETRNIAERLQRSLLPRLPDAGNLQLAARYAASSATAQVGGDWYDSFVLPDGDIALVIGDVTGHNLDAAIAMSQLRSMLRGIAVDRQEPPETVLHRLDMANHSLYREATATCIYGLVKGAENGPWNLLHSSAGHLPPLLIHEDGRTRYLEDGSGLLLGVDPDVPRPQGRNAVPAHSTVLLYTDGLIERREEHLDDAMERLRRHASALAREPLDVLCDELLIGLGADSDDDIAVLAVRPVPPR